MKLDGKDKIQPTPFDAHEKATRGEHVHTSADSPDRDPASVKEYPKAIDHVPHPHQAGHFEPVIANSAEEEAAYFAEKNGGEEAEA